MGAVMKLKFKTQAYQTAAVQAVVDCFKGQPPATPAAIRYRIDPGKERRGTEDLFAEEGFKNSDLQLADTALLDNIRAVQHAQNLPLSDTLVKTKVARVNLDIEMETGTGKTYCYIKTMFELNKRYGWSKFIVVVPSIAIREGVRQVARNHRRALPGAIRQTRPLLHLQLQAVAQPGELFFGRRHQRDGHQRPGVQRDRARTPAASTRSWTTSSRAAPLT